MHLSSKLSYCGCHHWFWRSKRDFLYGSKSIFNLPERRKEMIINSEVKEKCSNARFGATATWSTHNSHFNLIAMVMKRCSRVVVIGRGYFMASNVGGSVLKHKKSVPYFTEILIEKGGLTPSSNTDLWFLSTNFFTNDYSTKCNIIV